MSNLEKVYSLEISENNIQNTVRFFFISKGVQDVVKAIEYSYVQEFDGKPMFNLGFGNYDIDIDKIEDLSTNNNGDVYIIFSTVLSSIPEFFKINPASILLVQGSDSSPEFLEKCKLICKKKCTIECKKFRQRITIYKKYVNDNYDELRLEYKFYGGIKSGAGTIIETYVPKKDYDAVFVYK
ncbi:MAG: hypothetical protein H7068_11650 [Pedobacter sp.]|nr:hypothetical protein [Chitinophagaceae bacterium]